MKKNFTEIEEIIENRIAELKKNTTLTAMTSRRSGRKPTGKTDGATIPSPWTRKKRKSRKKNGTTAASKNSSPRSA